MKLMSWNIRLGIQRGLAPLAQTLNAQAPDVVALQEVGRHWIMGPAGDTTRQLASFANMPYWQFVPCIRTSTGAEYGHAVLSRFPLRTPRVVKLPREIDEPRCLFVAEVDIPDHPFTLFTTHLSHVADRHAQARVLTDAVSVPGPKILMGDLNESASAWLDDLRQHLEDPGSDTQPTYPSDAPSVRIDYILGRGFTFDSAEVLSTEDASDHLPVVVTSSWPS
ncbi:MAG: endonuclease/exonuclease/phosphatase family protein [bacterium]